jgi:hypothetical protein
MVIRTVRGLVVSPWFAASAGFVIAASVLVFTPHAVLDPAIRVTPCGHACGGVTPEPQGAAAPKPAGVGAGKVPGASGTSSATAGMTFSYEMLWQNDGGFGMVITARGQRALGSWHLQLVIPGAAHLTVYGADWKPTSRDGGTASGSGGSGGTSWHQDAVSAAPILNRNLLVSDELWSGQNIAQFYVRGTGTAGAPTGCAYNASPCHFVPLTRGR